jgi:O-antigen/teichoic acid export membrane protein
MRLATRTRRGPAIVIVVIGSEPGTKGGFRGSGRRFRRELGLDGVRNVLLSRVVLLSTLLDQAFISALNFSIVMLVSKTARLEVFSTFVIIQAGALLLVALSQSFASHPLLSLSQRYRGEGRVYERSVVLLNGAFVVMVALITGLALSRFYELDTRVVGGFVLYASSLATYELMRRVLYASKQALASAFASLFLSCLALWMLWLRHSSVEEILITLGCAYLMVALCALSIQAVSNFRSSDKGADLIFSDPKKLGSLVAQHWDYGKWVTPGVVAFWITTQAYLFLASYYLGPEEVSVLRAAQNIAGTLTILLVALENVLTPVYAEVAEAEGFRRLDNVVRRHQGYLSGISISLLGLGAPLTFAVSWLLYPESGAAAHIVATSFFVGYALQLVNRSYVCALRSVRITRPFMVAQAAAAAVTLILGVAVLPIFGTLGGPLVFILATVVFFYAIKHSYLKHIRRKESA